MPETVKYATVTFPSSRQLTMDIGYIGLRKHHVQALIEVDVTAARQLIKNRRRVRHEKLSVTAWVVKCISQAVAENKAVHGLRQGKNKLILFEDVDISMTVERAVGGVKVPLPVTIRQANEKPLAQIQCEIQAAKEQEIADESDYVLGKKHRQWMMKFFISWPQWLRLIVWKMILKNPLTMKNMMGTVMVTSVGMMGTVKGWAIPVTIFPVCFALGSIVKKPGVFQNNIAIREYLHLTVLIDHDVIDGAPAARFISRLTELMESGFGL